MKIIYHKKFENPDYAADPAAEEGRMKCIVENLKEEPYLEFIEARSADREELELVHSQGHIDRIKDSSDLLFEMASLAAGGAVEAAELAVEGVPTFALIRPPGHHASPDSSWGFCYFNNMGIAIEKLRGEGKIESAFILDFDLHTGDGNINSIGGESNTQIINPVSRDRDSYMAEVSGELKGGERYDILGVSAGFDEHEEDWGGKLKTEDYRNLGIWLKDFSKRRCEGRRFALLEGGYNQDVLGKNVAAFIDGFS